MKYFIGITFILLSIPVFSQHYCQIELAGKTKDQDSISMEALLANPILTVPAACANYTITSFTAVMTVDGSTISMTGYGSHLSTDILEPIRKMTKPGHIIIQAVHCKLPNGKTATTGIIAGINITVYQNNK